MTEADKALMRYMWEITNDMEGVQHNLPAFARFDEEGMSEDDVATILVHLENHYQRHIRLTWLPECLMDICDIIQGRPRTLDQIRAKAREQETALTLKPFVPIEKHGIWTMLSKITRVIKEKWNNLIRFTIDK